MFLKLKFFKYNHLVVFHIYSTHYLHNYGLWSLNIVIKRLELGISHLVVGNCCCKWCKPKF